MGERLEDLQPFDPGDFAGRSCLTLRRRRVTVVLNHGPERLMLDWIIGVTAANPTLFPGTLEQMTEFGLTKNQQDVLLSGDSDLIRMWVASATSDSIPEPG